MIWWASLKAIGPTPKENTKAIGQAVRMLPPQCAKNAGVGPRLSMPNTPVIKVAIMAEMKTCASKTVLVECVIMRVPKGCAAAHVSKHRGFAQTALHSRLHGDRDNQPARHFSVCWG